MAHTARAYPGFHIMKQLEVLLLPLDDPSISSDFPDRLPVPIYAPGWREALWE